MKEYNSLTLTFTHLYTTFEWLIIIKFYGFTITGASSATHHEITHYKDTRYMLTENNSWNTYVWSPSERVNSSVVVSCVFIDSHVNVCTPWSDISRSLRSSSRRSRKWAGWAVRTHTSGKPHHRGCTRSSTFLVDFRAGPLKDGTAGVLSIYLSI